MYTWRLGLIPNQVQWYHELAFIYQQFFKLKSYFMYNLVDHKLCNFSLQLQLIWFCSYTDTRRSWVRIPPKLPVDFVHRHSESTEYTVLHTLRRRKGKNQINCLSLDNAKMSSIYCINFSTFFPFCCRQKLTKVEIWKSIFETLFFFSAGQSLLQIAETYRQIEAEREITVSHDKWN